MLLQPGLNVLTVTAEDLSGNTATDTLAVMLSPGDGDQDGLLDVWEIMHFGTLALTAEEDSDSDGQSNAFEQTVGTNPANGGSRFVASMNSNAVDGSIVLSWPSLPGRSYIVEASETLTGLWTALATVSAEAGPATTTSYRNGLPRPASGRQFYRVKLE